MNPCKITSGLFFKPFKLRRYLSDLRIYFMRRRFLLKNGYPEPALWECFSYFRYSWMEILTNLRYNNHGTPSIFETDEEWEAILDQMIEYLKLMDIDNDEENKAYAAKDEFFKLFSKYFYCLWD